MGSSWGQSLRLRQAVIAAAKFYPADRQSLCIGETGEVAAPASPKLAGFAGEGALYFELGSVHILTLELPVVIRCLLRPSNELRRAMETLNRYIDGGRKRAPTTDLRGIENS